MSRKLRPFLSHSELTDCIYIIDGNDKYEVTEQCIKAMEATNRMPRWIPCNERLPEEDGQYLITVKYKHVDGYVDIYAEHGEWFERKWDMLFGHCGEVEAIIAWMPLPGPYKSEIPTGAEGSEE